jgi:hypothetical protein
MVEARTITALAVDDNFSEHEKVRYMRAAGRDFEALRAKARDGNQYGK